MSTLKHSQWVWALCGALACSSGAVPAPVDAAGLRSVKITHVELARESFAPMLAKLLRDGEATPKRLNDLVAVVRHQFGRAQAYFDSGQEEQGLSSVMGALLLVRAGEFRDEMLLGATDTLIRAANVVARTGDEGRAGAFYSLVESHLTDPQVRNDVQEHLRALEAWEKTISTEGSMVGAGARRMEAAKRGLVWPSPDHVDVARRRTQQWVERAFAIGREDGPPRSHDDFDERSEAHRAVMLGAAAMVAIYLRDGDAAGAVAALDSEPMTAIASTRLISRLSDAADGEADAWADMFGFYESPATPGQVSLDPDLARGAAWGAAVALYREEPEQIRAVLPLSMLLIDYGMADAAPLLFQSALGPQPDVKELNWALRSVMQALATAEQRGDVQLARGIFDNSKRLVGLASKRAYADEARPGAADFWYAMGAMESRAGNLDAAHAHLEAAVALEPTPQCYRLIAAIERQRGDSGAALRSLAQMLNLVRKLGDPGTEAATQLMIYDVLRESGRQPEANSALSSALHSVLAARLSARTSPELAAVERVLADVLERYGELAAASRAVARAGDAARNDLQQLTATVLDAARRALVLGDLNAGRQAMHWALEWDLDDQDLIYAALWVKLLNERVGASSDGSVEEALARVDSDGTWHGSLRDWARGTITDEQLLGRADSAVQKVEARFYVALTKHFGDRKKQSLEPLEAVASSEAIELVEVRMARDLLAESRGLARPKLPNDVQIP